MVTGHRYKQPMCGFTKKVRLKIKTDKHNTAKMESDWGMGCFLRMNGRTLEHLIGTENGIIKRDTFRRMLDDEAYDKACLEVVGIGYRNFVLQVATPNVMSSRPSDRLPKNPETFEN